MPKVLMLYYSVYGHLEVMAYEVAAGAREIAGTHGERMPSEQERAMARFQGRHVTEIAKRLFG